MKFEKKDEDELVERIAGMARKCIREKEFGEYQITITMHGGLPVRIAETDWTNYCKRSGGKIIINK